jgi:hypothetical protein
MIDITKGLITNNIRNLWRKLFDFDVNARRVPLPTVSDHTKQLEEWSNRKPSTVRYMTPQEVETLRLNIIEALIRNGTSRTPAEELTATLGKNLTAIVEPAKSNLEAILTEITEAHSRGLVWNHETQSWERPENRQQTRRTNIKSGDGPVTVKDMILKIFPGAQVVGPEPTPEDWAAIEQEGARWWRDTDGVWHKRENSLGGCKHCCGNDVPEWRRGGKLIEARYPDGVRTICHYCGRVADDEANKRSGVRERKPRKNRSPASSRKIVEISQPVDNDRKND